MEPTLLEVHFSTLGTVTLRRHLPTCTTTGTFSPTGTFSRVNLPRASVTALTMGAPLTSDSQLAQVAPLGRLARSSLGT